MDPIAPVYVDRAFNRTSPYYEREAFPQMDRQGFCFFSGANLRVYFDDILVDTMDSVGYQLAQNIRPIYGYHSHVWNGLQRGTKIVQGYFQLHFTESSYLPAMLALIEHNRRRRLTPRPANQPNREPQQRELALGGHALHLGETLDEALEYFSSNGGSNPKGTVSWKDLADEYDARRFGATTMQEGRRAIDQLAVEGLFPAKAGTNDFTYAPRGTHLKEEGFTISLVHGPVEDSFDDHIHYDEKLMKCVVNKERVLEDFYGSVVQLHNVQIVAGPNNQTNSDGKPISNVYTFISRDIT